MKNEKKKQIMHTHERERPTKKKTHKNPKKKRQI